MISDASSIEASQDLLVGRVKKDKRRKARKGCQAAAAAIDLRKKFGAREEESWDSPDSEDEKFIDDRASDEMSVDDMPRPRHVKKGRKKRASKKQVIVLNERDIASSSSSSEGEEPPKRNPPALPKKKVVPYAASSSSDEVEEVDRKAEKEPAAVVDLSTNREKRQTGGGGEPSLIKRRRDDGEVVFLTKAWRTRQHTKVVLNNVWSIFTDEVSFVKGASQGTYEVLSIERAPKDPAQKPFRFNVPRRHIKHVRAAVANLDQALNAGKILRPSVEDMDKIRNSDSGVLDMRALLGPAHPRTAAYRIDHFEVRLEEVVFRNATGSASFEALTIAKKNPNPASGSGDGGRKPKEFSVSIPATLIPFLSAALEYIITKEGEA